MRTGSVVSSTKSTTTLRKVHCLRQQCFFSNTHVKHYAKTCYISLTFELKYFVVELDLTTFSCGFQHVYFESKCRCINDGYCLV